MEREAAQKRAVPARRGTYSAAEIATEMCFVGVPGGVGHTRDSASPGCNSGRRGFESQPAQLLAHAGAEPSAE